MGIVEAVNGDGPTARHNKTRFRDEIAGGGRRGGGAYYHNMQWFFLFKNILCFNTYNSFPSDPTQASNRQHGGLAVRSALFVVSHS